LIEVTVLLADYADRSDSGKVSAIGLGWERCPTPLPAHAVIMFIRVPWDQTNKKILFKASLVTGDGLPVSMPGPLGLVPLSLEGQLELGRPPGSVEGVPFTVPFVFHVGAGVAVTPGRYEWRVDIPTDLGPGASAAFTAIEPVPGTLNPALPGL